MIKSIGIIGFGNMGSAFYNGLKKNFPDLAFMVYDHHSEKLSNLPEAEKSSDLTDLIKKSDCLLLAIKPQGFDDLSAQINEWTHHKLVISIMAGVTIDSIAAKLKTTKVIRSMPNLPVQVLHGAIGWVSQSIDEQEKQIINSWFEVLGHSIELKDESMMEAITLITGCGPGYFYFFTELIAKKAVEFGFSDDQAQKLAQATFIGSAELMKEGARSPVEMKEAVASKGGVTEAALNYWLAHDFQSLFEGGVEAARKRNKELN